MRCCDILRLPRNTIQAEHSTNLSSAISLDTTRLASYGTTVIGWVGSISWERLSESACLDAIMSKMARTTSWTPSRPISEFSVAVSRAKAKRCLQWEDFGLDIARGNGVGTAKLLKAKPLQRRGRKPRFQTHLYTTARVARMHERCGKRVVDGDSSSGTRIKMLGA